MFDVICYFCIDVLRWWSRLTSISYGTINVWLFILLQPLMIIIFFATTVYQTIGKNERVKKIILRVSIVLFVIITLIGILSVVIPLFDPDFAALARAYKNSL